MYHEEQDSAYALFSQIIRFHYHRMHILLDKLGLYPGQPGVLFILGKQSGQSQKELAEKLHIKAGTVAVMLNRMEKAQLIERHQDQSDQRISRVYLTKHGEMVRDQVKEAFKTIETECFKDFTTEEQVLLRRLFMQMRDNLRKLCDKNSD